MAQILDEDVVPAEVRPLVAALVSARLDTLPPDHAEALVERLAVRTRR